MDSKWRVIDLTGFKGFLSYERGKLKVGDGHSVPLADLDFILVGQGCTWGYGLVAGLERFDVGMAVCDWRNMPISVLTHWSENTRVFARQEAQSLLSVPRRKNAWMRLIKAKIQGQSNIMAEQGEEATAKRLEELVSTVRSGDPANCEALAARLYWSRFLGDEPFSRDQSRQDPVNAMLNYGYTILRGRVITRIVATGLSPTLSLFHRHRGNRFALADDLIEPFRPAVDREVLNLYKEGTRGLGREEKAALSGVLAEHVSTSDFTVRSDIEKLCQEFALYVEGEREFLDVPYIELKVKNG